MMSILKWILAAVCVILIVWPLLAKSTKKD
jgi:hypothetical protein